VSVAKMVAREDLMLFVDHLQLQLFSREGAKQRR